jgi:hypothetical protein
MSPRELRQSLFNIDDQDNGQLLVKVGDQYFPVTGVVVGGEPNAPEGAPVLLCTKSDMAGVSTADKSILFGVNRWTRHGDV